MDNCPILFFEATNIFAHRLMSTKIGLHAPLGSAHNARQLTSMQRVVDQLVFVQAFGSGQYFIRVWTKCVYFAKFSQKLEN